MRFLLMSRQYPASYLSLYEVCDQSWTLSSEGEIKTGSGPKLFSIFLVMIQVIELSESAEALQYQTIHRQ